ncbi:Proline iminopeptidase [Polaribacter huanghezhanensis]|uniref:proline iminopeptidase-family hydrolase n=1 Tax=Polaribacter huanghezhanensis TaxID=1354726 RepID=UPI0026488AE3|nr:proline iminopeptidase-family hydrolase [Polaribacter huanghezhanensis]WKD86894.1 Proline iminopeptidase [Polaribacter huanghezhanensis]
MKKNKTEKYFKSPLVKNSFIFIGILTLLIASCAPLEKPTNPYLKAKNGYVQVEGGKIWYAITGEGDNTPLLYLHGGPGGTSNFNLSEIADERPVIVFDQLGNGRSDHHKDTTLLKVHKLVEQVRAIKTTLKLNEFYLSGGSWGTALALEYYNKYPEGVKGLIFNSPYFSTKIWTDDADILIAALPDSIQSAIRIAEADSIFETDSYANANKVFAKKHGRRTAYKKHPSDTLKYTRDSFIYNFMWGPSEFTSTGTLRNYDIHQTLKDITVPVLFTTGEFDEARPETVKKFSEMVPNSTMVIIEGAGHSTSNDNRPALIAALKQFLKNQKK